MTSKTARRSSTIAAVGAILLLSQQSADAFTCRQPLPTMRRQYAVQTNADFLEAQCVSNSEQRRLAPTALQGWFGGGGGTDSKKDAILGTFDISSSSDGDSQVQFESLSDYVRNKWAPLFVTGNIKLTTPVKLDQIALSVSSEDDGVNVASGVRLLFQKVDTGYKSKKEEEQAKSGEAESKKKKEKDEPSQGGVEVLVEQMEDGSLSVVAKRCDVDDDTMIKEMSEEKILAELQTAIDVWKKDSA